MKNSIRWLLTESKISELDPNKINFIDGKLICYHLTAHKRWASYNPLIADKLDNPIIKHPKQERSADDSRVIRILKNLKDKNRISKRESYDIEEEVIMDMIRDPYTDTSGFSPGGGDWHGRGLYTCYKFNPRISWIYGDICLAFEIDISNFIIAFEDLAKQVHGEDWRVKDQIVKLYKRQSRDEESLRLLLKMLDRVGFDKLDLSPTINKTKPISSQISYALMKTFGKEHISSIYDGIVFMGKMDGPVCVSFYPKYDAKLIGLGRLSKRSAKADVDWYDSLNDFLGGRARNKQDFQTMNNIAEENTSLEEKEQDKEDEREFYDAKFSYVLSTLKVISHNEEVVNRLVEFHEELKNSGSKESLEAFYKEVGTGDYIARPEEFDVLSQEVLQKYEDILEETYQLHKNSSSKYIDNFYYSIGALLGYASGINFSDDLLINGVYNAHKKIFAGEKFKNNINTLTSSEFLVSAKKYIKNQNYSGEFARLVKDLEDTYGLDIKLKEADWIELINLYENSNQEVKDKIINLPETAINRHPFKLMSLLNSSGNYVQVHYYRSKEIIDKFCNIVDIMIKKRNINILDSLQLAFDHVEHPLSNIVIEKSVDELLALPEGENKNRLTGYLAKYFDKFSSSNTAITDKFDAVLALVMQTVEKEFNKLIDNLEKKTNPQSVLLNYNDIRYDSSKKHYFESQTKEWHEILINLIIENVETNSKFLKLKRQTLELIAYSISIKDIVISEQDQRLLLKSAGNHGYLLLDYKHMSQNNYVSYMILALKDNIKSILNATQVSASLFKNIYSDKRLLDAFIQYSDNPFFKRTLQRLIAPLKGEKVDLLVSNYTPNPNDNSRIDMSKIIDFNDDEWFNYLLEEIRTKTNSGKTKKAEKLFKEFDTLIAQRNVSQDVVTPELDLSHRKIFGNSLKEVYSLIVKKENF